MSRFRHGPPAVPVRGQHLVSGPPPTFCSSATSTCASVCSSSARSSKAMTSAILWLGQGVDNHVGAYRGSSDDGVMPLKDAGCHTKFARIVCTPWTVHDRPRRERWQADGAGHYPSGMAGLLWRLMG